MASKWWIAAAGAATIAAIYFAIRNTSEMTVVYFPESPGAIDCPECPDCSYVVG